MRALSVGALDFGAGEVCALSALCALSPSFTQFTEDLPPRLAGLVRWWRQVVKELPT
ncbi:MAG: hypothetical protein QOJ42_3300 [Acidobacteriaceae bacterium]|nr:hypothetical protein [Acidobacteriaceae bacterium]